MPDPPGGGGGGGGGPGGGGPQEQPPLCEYVFDAISGDWLNQNAHLLPPGWECDFNPPFPPGEHGDVETLPAFRSP